MKTLKAACHKLLSLMSQQVQDGFERFARIQAKKRLAVIHL